MVRRHRLSAAACMAAVGLLGTGAVHAATPAIPVIEQRELWLQPIGSSPTSLSASTIERMVTRAASWADGASDGRWRIHWAGVRPALTIADDTCAGLTRAVALDRQRRAGDTAITLYVGNAKDCPYRGLAETPGSWLLIPHVTAGSDTWTRTIAHELGHTLGLVHAGAQTCSILTASRSSRQGCRVDEYGDRTDPMGRATLDWGLGPLSRAALGWSRPVEVAAVGRSDISLAAEEAVVVEDPISGVRYAIAHRVPAGAANARAVGVHVYRMPASTERDVMSVHLPWITAPALPWGGRDGMAYRSATRSLAIEVQAVTSDRAQVTITRDPAGEITDQWGPVFVGDQPTLRADGTVRIPQAHDQSGVVRYAVRVNGRAVATRSASAGLSVQTVDLSPRGSELGTVRVVAVDAAGNVTSVRVR